MFKRIESGTLGRRSLKFGYLLWVVRKANKFKLKGYVLKREDGGIKVIAEGEEKNLIKFAKRLKRGRLFVCIENFYVKWLEPSGEFRDFFILEGIN